MQSISEILTQKKWPPKNYNSAYVKGFDHWYLPENLNRIDSVLRSIKRRTVGNRCLDIAFGNPFILKREIEIFEQCQGIYITLDEALQQGVSESIITKGNCYQIPFDDEAFDLVSGYALLHIIPDIPLFYKEAYRVLKKGGYLYTDGDKNIFITKMIRKIKMVQYNIFRDRIKFEYWKNILNEKSNFHQEGINYIKLKKTLKKIGFRKVIITPWFSAKPEYNKKITFQLMKKLFTIINLKFLFTHIQILAIK
jgi:ubiquinone/menaquinone biosynthesis C-methylase UbiE